MLVRIPASIEKKQYEILLSESDRSNIGEMHASPVPPMDRVVSVTVQMDEKLSSYA